MKLVKWVVLAVGLAVTAPAFAHDRHVEYGPIRAGYGPGHSRFDLNRDGVVSRFEARRMREVLYREQVQRERAARMRAYHRQAARVRAAEVHRAYAEPVRGRW